MMPLAERFESKYIPVTETGCWLWTASTNAAGYGQFAMREPKKRPYLAHRVSWEMANGGIPDGMLVCHKCDTPACVNPDHLFIGTNLDNNRDMVIKGRANNSARASGEAHGMCKLSKEQVLAIYADKRTQNDIAASFSVSRGTVQAIHQGRLWSHTTGAKK